MNSMSLCTCKARGKHYFIACRAGGKVRPRVVKFRNIFVHTGARKRKWRGDVVHAIHKLLSFLTKFVDFVNLQNPFKSVCHPKDV